MDAAAEARRKRRLDLLAKVVVPIASVLASGWFATVNYDLRRDHDAMRESLDRASCGKSDSLVVQLERCVRDVPDVVDELERSKCPSRVIADAGPVASLRACMREVSDMRAELVAKRTEVSNYEVRDRDALDLQRQIAAAKKTSEAARANRSVGAGGTP